MILLWLKKFIPTLFYFKGSEKREYFILSSFLIILISPLIMVLFSWFEIFSFTWVYFFTLLINDLLSLALFTRRLRVFGLIKLLPILFLPIFGYPILWFICARSSKDEKTIADKGYKTAFLSRIKNGYYLSVLLLVFSYFILFAFSSVFIVEKSNSYENKRVLIASEKGVLNYTKKVVEYVNQKNPGSNDLELIGKELVHVEAIVAMKVVRTQDYIIFKALANEKAAYKIVVYQGKAFVEKG